MKETFAEFYFAVLSLSFCCNLGQYRSEMSKHQFQIDKVQQFYMASKCASEMDTEIASPTVFRSQITAGPHFNIRGDTRTSSWLTKSSQDTSMTHKLLHSHQIVHRIIQKSEAKTLNHYINHVDPNTELYARPLPNLPLPQQISEYTAQIKQIDSQLNAGTTVEEKVARLRVAQNKRPHSAYTKPLQKDPKITVSGLTTYNFNSVKAGKTLGFQKQLHQDRMENDKQSFEHRKHCSELRKHSILERKSTAARKFYQENNKLVFCDFELSTDDYLRLLSEEKDNQKVVYRERKSKLQCMKNYMIQERVGYEEAQHIIDQIVKVEPLTPKTKPNKLIINDEYELTHRRLPVCKNKTMVRHLCFVE